MGARKFVLGADGQKLLKINKLGNLYNLQNVFKTNRKKDIY